MTAKAKTEKIDKAALEQIKSGLLKRKKEIENEITDLSGECPASDSQKVKFPDFGDKIDENAQEIGEYSTNLATEKILYSTLRDINNALKRIEDGTYGICKYCKQPIGKKRMLARPVASACVECKTKLQNAV